VGTPIWRQRANRAKCCRAPGVSEEIGPNPHKLCLFYDCFGPDTLPRECRILRNISELKKQIEPRERDIRNQQEQIHEMESELERFHKSNTALELSLTELRQKLRASDIELEEERLRVRDSRSLNTRILADLHEAVN